MRPKIRTLSKLDQDLQNLRDYLEGNTTELQVQPDLETLKLEVASFTRLMIKKYMSRLIKLGEKLEALEDELLSQDNFPTYLEKVEFYNSLVQSYNMIFSNLKSLVPVLKELSKLSNSIELKVVNTEESSALQEIELNQQARETLRELLGSVVQHLEV